MYYMPATFIWDTLVSSCAGCFSVLRGALSDAIALPSRCLAPVAAAAEYALDRTSPALSAIVSGSLLPNLMLFGSICLVTVSLNALEKNGGHGTPQRAVLGALRLAESIARAVFAGDALLQSVRILQVFLGRFCEMPALLPGYALQSVFLSAYCVPNFSFTLLRTPGPKVLFLLKLAATLLHAVSFIRVAEQLEGSNASLLAGVTLAFTASRVTHSSAHHLFSLLNPHFQPNVALPRIENLSIALFFSVLSLYNGRLLPLDAVAVFYFVETLTPWSLKAFLQRRIMAPALSALTSAVKWLYTSAWPLIRRTIATTLAFLCRLSPPFRLLHRWVVAPLWLFLSPLAIPCAMLLIAHNRAGNALRAASLPALLAEVVFAATSALASLVLFCHAFSRISRSSIDPLRLEALRWVAAACCNCLLFPIDVAHVLIRFLWKMFVRAVCECAWPVVAFILQHVIWPVINALISCSKSAPVISVICILATNVSVMYLCYSHSFLSYPLALFTASMHALKHLVTSPFSAAFSRLARIATPDYAADGSDMLLALCILALVQVSCCIYTRRVLRGCRPLPRPVHQQQHVTPQELQEVADSMTEPRQVRCMPLAARAHHSRLAEVSCVCLWSRRPLRLRRLACASRAAWSARRDHVQRVPVLRVLGANDERVGAMAAANGVGAELSTAEGVEHCCGHRQGIREVPACPPVFHARVCRCQVIRLHQPLVSCHAADAACSLSPSVSAAVVIAFSCAAVAGRGPPLPLPAAVDVLKRSNTPSLPQKMRACSAA